MVGNAGELLDRLVGVTGADVEVPERVGGYSSRSGCSATIFAYSAMGAIEFPLPQELLGAPSMWRRGLWPRGISPMVSNSVGGRKRPTMHLRVAKACNGVKMIGRRVPLCGDQNRNGVDAVQFAHLPVAGDLPR